MHVTMPDSVSPHSLVSHAQMSHVVYRGMQRFFRVIGDPVRGRRRVSLAAVETRLYHRRLRQMMEHRATVVATVVGVNRGGLLLEMDGIAGFCPSAQLALRPDQLAGLVGREMRFKVQTLDTSSFTCVLSQVRLLNEEALPEGSQVGDVVEGEVAQVRDFGAFLLVAGRSGLLPWQQVPVRDTAPAGAPLRVGERVRVRITSHDRVKGLLNLSMLAAQPDAPTVGAAADGTPRYAQPWLVSRRTYPISQMPLGENDDDDEEEGGVDLGDLPLNDGDEVAATSEPDAFDAPRTEPLSSEDAPVDRDAALPSWPAGFGPEPRNRARARQAGIRRRPTTLEELVADCQGETSAEDDDGLLDDGDDVDDAESELLRLGESEEEATKRRLLARLHKRFPQITRRFPSVDPDSYFLRLRPRR